MKHIHITTGAHPNETVIKIDGVIPRNITKAEVRLVPNEFPEIILHIIPETIVVEGPAEVKEIR